MAQNLETIISNRVVGAADVQGMTDALRKHAEAIEGLTQKAQKVNEHPGFSAFAEKVRAGISDPLGTAGSIAEDFLKKLGPVGAGVAAAGAVFAVAGAAGLAFARDLGHLADETEDMAARMGLTIKEAGEFRFAMKYAGGDASSLQGIMRKLSQEIEDGGANLRAIGVEYRDLGTGKIRPTSQIVLELSERLKRMPDVYDRNTAAIKVMGKGALEVLPDLLELAEGVKRAKELGLAPTEDEIKRWGEYHKRMVEVDEQWEALKRKFKEPLAATVLFTVKQAQDASNLSEGLMDLWGQILFGGTPTAQDREMSDTSGYGYGTSESRSRRRTMTASVKRSDAAIDALLAPNELERARKKLSSLEAKLPRGVPEYASREAREEYRHQLDIVKSLEAREKATKDLEAAIKSLGEIEKKARENYREAYFGDNPFGQLISQRIGLQEQRAATLQQFAGRPDLQARADSAFGSDFAALGLKWASEMRKWRDAVQKALDSAPIPETEDAIKRLNEAASATGLLDADGMPRIIGGNLPLMAPPPGYISPEQQLRNARRSDQRNISLFGVRSALSGATPGDQISGLYALRLQAAKEEEAALLRIADQKGDLVAREDALNQAQERRYEAALEREYALLELQHRMVESVRGEFGGVFDALTGGSGGMRQFLTGQARTLGRAGFANTATSLLTGSKISRESTFGGTWLGDVFAAKSDPSMKLNVAGDRLIVAAQMQVEAARALAMSPSAGGGGSAGTISSLFGGLRGTDIEGGWGGGGSTPSQYLGGGDWGDGTIMPTKTSWGMSPLARGAGIAGAAAGAGFGIYSGVSMGGGRGALTAAGSALAGAGAIMSLASKALNWAGPVGMLAGMGLGMLTSLWGDPKQKRAEAMERDRAARMYDMPTGYDYQVDTYGRGYDRDFTGRMRPIYNYYIQAIEPQSFVAWGKANPGAISEIVSHANYNDGGQLAASVAQVSGS